MVASDVDAMVLIDSSSESLDPGNQDQMQLGECYIYLLAGA